MTREELILLAATRLGDESTDFLEDLDPLFDDVLRDLAASDALLLLRKTAQFTPVADQRTYDTRTITGLSSPDYPKRILSLVVANWSPWAVIDQADNNEQFERLRYSTDPTLSSRWRIWRLYPNETTLEVWPPADAAAVDDAGANGAEILYEAPPTSLGDTDEIEEVRQEDLETLKWGIIARAAHFRDETLALADLALQHYERGKARIWARTHNGRPGRIEPRPF